MEIGLDVIIRMSELCRLKFNDLEAFREEFARIVGFVDAVRELEIKGVEPMYYPGRTHCREREDEIRASLSKDDALKNAPEKIDDFFSVPRVF